MRVEGWESRLAQYLETPTPFAWGSNDCALWSARWVKDCTENDYTGDWVGFYRTKRGAAIRMGRLGFANVAAIAAAHLTERPVLTAQRGDLILHPSGALGICNGLKSHFLTESGLLIENTLECIHAWAVS